MGGGVTPADKLERVIALGRSISELREELEVAEDELAKLIGEAPAEAAPPAPEPTPQEEVQKMAKTINSSATATAAKRGVLEQIYPRVAMIHLDPRCEGVDLPAHLMRANEQVLRVGEGLTPPITDLAWDDDGFRCTLSFGGKPHLCLVPWTAVFAILIGGTRHGAVWPMDVPEDYHAAPPTGPKPKHLTSVPMPELGEPKTTDYCATCGESPESGSHLPHGHEYVDPRRAAPTPPANPELRVVPWPRCWTCLDDPRGQLFDMDGFAGYRACPECRPPLGAA